MIVGLVLIRIAEIAITFGESIRGNGCFHETAKHINGTLFPLTCTLRQHKILYKTLPRIEVIDLSSYRISILNQLGINQQYHPPI